MRTRQAVPVIAVALSLVLLTLGSSSASVQKPAAKPSPTRQGGGLVIAHQPAPSPSVAVPSKPPDKTGGSRTPGASATTQRSDPSTPEAAAVDVVANLLNGRAFERALDEPDFTEDSPSDARGVASSYWESSSLLWEELADRLRLKTNPLTFRPLVYNTVHEDMEDTGCAYLNGDSKVVRSSSPAPFFCNADGAGGRIYWPIKSAEKRWADSGLPDGTVIRGYAIWLNQLYGQYIGFAVYNTHNRVLGAESLIRPMYDVIGLASMCFAGTILQASFLDREALLAGVSLIYPGEPGKKYEAALAYGFDQNDLGKCVATYWPRTQ
ncbi:MAG TPA: hypothetical protein VJM32_01710 [Candidatus Saccharimonadales bacterium]|nr:hypothetical protein [Candidatus Saccharimonadales bacterium]